MIQEVFLSQQEQELTIQTEIPLKDYRRPYYLTFIICFSTIYSGCSITIISASNLQGLIDYYAIEHSKESTLALLNGVLPAGGMLGAILVPNFIALATKKKLIYYIAGASVVVCGVSLVPQLFLCVLSRFLLGVINGLQMSLASAYIKQLFPGYIRKPLGCIYSICRIIGMIFCYFVALMSDYTAEDYEHLIIFLGPAMISVIQSILFYWFMPDSIVEMISKQREGRAKECLGMLYASDNVEKRYQQLRMEMKMAVRRTISFQNIRIANRKNLCSLHLAMLRQFCGETYIVIYARQIMKSMDSPYANVTPAIVNCIQLLAGLIGILAVTRVSRFQLILSSCCILAVLNVFIAVTDLFDQSLQCLITMAAFMMPNGVGLSSIAWSYPSELVPASQGKYSSLLNWACSTIVVMVPPYIIRQMPDGSAYPIFFFFALYLLVAIFLNMILLPRIDRPMGETEKTMLINYK